MVDVTNKEIKIGDNVMTNNAESLEIGKVIKINEFLTQCTIQLKRKRVKKYVNQILLWPVTTNVLNAEN